MRVVEFARGTAILTPEMEPEHVYVLAQGHVELVEAGETAAVYKPPELFAVRALLAGRCSGSLVAMDAVRAWQIPGAVLRETIRTNAAFSAALFASLGGQLQATAGKRQDREFLSLMMAPMSVASSRGSPILSAEVRATSFSRNGSKMSAWRNRREPAVQDWLCRVKRMDAMMPSTTQSSSASS